MAATEEGLAVEMLRDRFGDVVAETARILLAYPASTLPQVLHHGMEFFERLELDGKQREKDKMRMKMFRDAMAVLMQHGLAQAVERAVEGKGKEGTFGNRCFVYYMQTGYALFQSRIPLYLGFVRRRYGDVGEEAMRLLFERGKLTAKQILNLMRERKLVEISVSEHDAEVCLYDLASSGLIKHAGRRSSLKNGEERENSEDDDTPIGEVGRKRPRSPDDGEMNGDQDRICVGRGHHRIIVGAPAKDNDEDFWTVCYWHLNREFRNQCCSMVAQCHLGVELANRILKVGMKIALDMEDCEAPSDDFETVEVDTDAIQKGLAEENPATVNTHEFWDAVHVLIQQSPTFVVGIPENAPTKLRFIPGRLVSEARQKTLDDLVMTRYGLIGRRVFKALAIEGGMEERMVAQKCMLPIKVIREHLFKLYQDRLVVMQEVPRSHDQMRASNWYYLWKVNAMLVYRNMNEIMYKTTLNLFLRLQSMEKAKAIGEDPRRIERQRELLRISTLRLDQSIMVMRDFGSITAAYLPAKYTIVDGPIGKVRKRR